MLAEHSFITTREGADTLGDATAFLVALGFRIQAGSEAHLEGQRGRPKPAQAQTLEELPQRVRVEFDRGRVSIAAIIQPAKKAGPQHADILLAILNGLEAFLARRVPMAEARAGCDEISRKCAEQLRASRRRRRRALIGLFASLVLGAIAITWALMR